MPTYFQPLDAPVPEPCRRGVVTIGNFDGVHLGHQALLQETVGLAHSLSGPAVAVSFDPHPQQLLRPESFQPILTTLEYRAELLHAHGADHVLVCRITSDFLRLTAREFFDQVLLQALGAKGIVEGFNFGFGKGREGTTDKLRQWGDQAGLRVALVEALQHDGRPVSTSRVRQELLTGNVSAAHALLARPYRLAGTVVVGQRRGQTLGFPTANLANVATLIPANGVYAVRVHVDGSFWPGAANIGPNPTFGEAERKIEVHLIGFQGDLYSKIVMVDFLEKIRDLRTFSGPAELIEQLTLDVGRARGVK